MGTVLRVVSELDDPLRLWDGAQPTETHPYLTRKGVPSYGLRQGAPGQETTTILDGGSRYSINLAGKLFVPMRAIHGKLWTLQYISDDGRKMYHPGGRKDGGRFVIPGAGPANCFVEGYATGASVHALSDGLPVIVAFDAGNLIEVSRSYPGEPAIICGDNDHARERECGHAGKPNAGKLAAIAAGAAVGGIVAVPEFAAEDSGSDWNGVHHAEGLDDARAKFRRALRMAERGNGRRTL
jgi:putative DNA primase/helicase